MDFFVYCQIFISMIGCKFFYKKLHIGFRATLKSSNHCFAYLAIFSAWKFSLKRLLSLISLAYRTTKLSKSNCGFCNWGPNAVGPGPGCLPGCLCRMTTTVWNSSINYYSPSSSMEFLFSSCIVDSCR